MNRVLSELIEKRKVMEKVYLLSFGELALKGKNRIFFVRRLIENVQKRLKQLGSSKIISTYGRILLKTTLPSEVIENALIKTFGLVGFSLVETFPLEFEAMEKGILELAKKEYKPGVATFKISGRRSNKNFPMRSEEINRLLGTAVLKQHPELRVDLKHPDLNLHLEVREQAVYAYLSTKKLSGGLPVGMSGKGVLMLSGGIDSPVAGWMMLKRGMNILPVHFASPPYTSPRAREKVISLAKILYDWGGDAMMLHVHFTPVQLKINTTRRKELTTLLIRKAMVKISEQLAVKYKRQALITGENLGQVASQTVESMTATGYGCPFPLFRPLIGFDKIEIISLAQKIGSFDTSILPYEDCCTIFLPENPKTKPSLQEIEAEFETLELSGLMEAAVATAEVVMLREESRI